MPIEHSAPPPTTCKERDHDGRRCTLDTAHEPRPHAAVWVEERVWTVHRWDEWGTVEREAIKVSASNGGWQKGDKGVLKSRLSK